MNETSWRGSNGYRRSGHGHHVRENLMHLHCIYLTFILDFTIFVQSWGETDLSQSILNINTIVLKQQFDHNITLILKTSIMFYKASK